MMNGFGGYGWGMGLGGISGILIIGFFVWFLLKGINVNNPSSQPREKSPLDILKERYAKGEIDKEYFEERKKDL